MHRHGRSDPLMPVVRADVAVQRFVVEGHANACRHRRGPHGGEAGVVAHATVDLHLHIAVVRGRVRLGRIHVVLIEPFELVPGRELRRRFGEIAVSFEPVGERGPTRNERPMNGELKRTAVDADAASHVAEGPEEPRAVAGNRTAKRGVLLKQRAGVGLAGRVVVVVPAIAGVGEAGGSLEPVRAGRTRHADHDTFAERRRRIGRRRLHLNVLERVAAQRDVIGPRLSE